MIEIKIDEEFRNKIPAPEKDEIDGLRADILKDGYVRDPLVVWKEENILLDGHHRWQIIQENKDVLDGKFTVDYKSFPNRWSAIAWMCGNQLHKRNLNEASRKKLIQEEFDAARKSYGGNDKTAHGSNGRFTVRDQNGLLRSEEKTGKWERTRTKIAKEHGLGEGTVQRAIEFGRGLDRADEVVPGIKAEVLSGKTKAPEYSIAAIRKMSDEDVKKAVDAIRNPQKKTDSGMKSLTAAKIVNAKISEIGRAMGDQSKKREMSSDGVVSMFFASCDDFISKTEQFFEIWGGILQENKNAADKVTEKLKETNKSIERIIGEL